MFRAVAFHFKEQKHNNSFYGIGGTIELDLTRKEVLIKICIRRVTSFIILSHAEMISLVFENIIFLGAILFGLEGTFVSKTSNSK